VCKEREGGNGEEEEEEKSSPEVAEDGVVSGRVSDGESVVVCNLDSEFIISISSPFSTSPSSLSLSSTTW
jgi:hypothetical protein